MFRHFSERTLKNVEGVHPVLTSCLLLAIVDFERQNPEFSVVVVSGLRTVAEQQELVDSGRSQTMNSRHLLGQAIDVAIIHIGNLEPEYMNDLHFYKAFNHVVQQIADQMAIDVTWGGAWSSFVDGPHFQLEMPNRA